MAYLVDNAEPRRAVLLAIAQGRTTWYQLAKSRGTRRTNTNNLRNSLSRYAMQRTLARDLLAEAGVTLDLSPVPHGWGNGGDYVLAAPVAAAVAGRIDLVDLAKRRGETRPDAEGLKRSLGIKLDRGHRSTQCGEELALWLCRQLDYDPVDWGL